VDIPKWLVPVLRSSNRYKGAWGGRGSGKSHGFALMTILRHLEDPNRATVCVREVQLSLKQSVKRLLETKIRELDVGHYFDIRSTEIRSRLGTGIILFQGMAEQTADSIKSLEGFDCTWVEEAQTISQRSLDLLRPTIRRPGSELWFTWNPQDDTDPIDVFLRGPDAPLNATVVCVNYKDNPWFPGDLEQELEYDRRHNFEKYLHVWEGEYLQRAEARVFKRWKIHPFETPKDAILRFGGDFGHGGPDPTVLIRCFLEGRKLYVDYEAYQIGCEIEDTPALFLTVPGAERWPIFVDSARPDRIKSLRRSGFSKIMPAVKGPGSVEAGVEWLENYEIIIHPRCVHTIDEVKTYSRVVDKATGKVLPLLEDKNNHVIDALRYACEAVRRFEEEKERAKPSNVIPLPTVSRWRCAA
jgi:phage terminase large subunit